MTQQWPDRAATCDTWQTAVLGVRVGTAHVQVDAFPDQVDFRPCPVGIGRELPLRRRLSRAAKVQGNMIDGVFCPYAREIERIAGKFRIEADIESRFIIIIFKIPKQRRLRPNILHVQQLAPAVMADDDIRYVAQPAQAARGILDALRTHHRNLEFLRVAMGVLRSQFRHRVQQLAHTGAARLAVELQAASADHLEKIDRRDIQALALSNVVCTMLPGCCFHLGLAHYGPARELIDSGAIVGLATDFNPGTSPTLSMSMILSLACTQMRMTPAEAIAAATINPAYSLRQHHRIGSLEVGKYADLASFDVAGYREIPYYFGVNLCSLTMKRGEIIHSKSRPKTS